MRKTERIAATEKKKQALARLEKKLMITTNSLYECKPDNTKQFCPFCGKKRKPSFVLETRTLYHPCDCEKYESAYKKMCFLLDRRARISETIEKVEERMERQKKQAERMMQESNLGRRFKERTFDNFDSGNFPEAAKIAFDYADSFDENKGGGLLFTGSPGTGKTHLAAAITNHIILEFCIPVKFGGFVNILDSVKKSFGTDDEIIENLVSVPLLVIDDLGKERKTEWSNSILYQVINGRYEDYKPVVITTNEDMKTLEQNIGQATMSRLVEMCRGVKMVGKDYRREKLIGG